ncbi:hypothetical protein Q5692_35700 [Microcoleus sp. C2C3]|uniref:hypothetical protein n=1 Tax=unclassified Microcoleus TaxID=2642155 RepID=UPI002FD55F00
MAEITYAQWMEKLSDTTLTTMITNASLPATTLPPAETLWKLMQSYKKAQDEWNVENAGGTLPSLATVDLLQLGPSVETNAEGRNYIRGRAQMQCIIFLDSNDVQGVTVI